MVTERNLLREYTQRLVEMKELGELTVGTVRELARMMVIANKEGEDEVMNINIAAGHETYTVAEAIIERGEWLAKGELPK